MNAAFDLCVTLLPDSKHNCKGPVSVVAAGSSLLSISGCIYPALVQKVIVPTPGGRWHGLETVELSEQASICILDCR